jgi:hypothetical protein
MEGGDGNFYRSLLEAVRVKPVVLGITAWLEHVPFAYWFTSVVKPSIFVELGTHYGTSYFAFCQAVKDYLLSTKCYAVDNWKGDPHAGFYSDEVFEVVSKYNYENYSGFSTLLRMSFDEGVRFFEDKTIDLLHIDGYHTYEAVKHDFETWLSKLADGAFVLFHDINVKMGDFGVWKFWEELKKNYPLNFEFYHGYGLGIIQISENEKSQIIHFLNENAQQVRNYFSLLGKFQKLNQVEDELVRTKQEKDELYQKLNYIEQQNRELQVKLNQKEEELVRVYMSKSWRITSPLRWFRRKLRDLGV